MGLENERGSVFEQSKDLKNDSFILRMRGIQVVTKLWFFIYNGWNLWMFKG